MKALVVENRQLLFNPDYPMPHPAPGEALIRILVGGICTTDLEVVKGYGDFEGVLGHEFVGEVVAAADTDWVGARVVGEINLGCNRCQFCLRGRPEHCVRRAALGIHNRDGAFADYMTLPLRNLHRVPASVPNETAVFTEPLAAALRIREQLQLRPSQKTAVIGPGRLGLLVGLVLSLAGCELLMLGRRRASLALPQQLGLSTSLTSDIDDNSFDLVVEATGNDGGFKEALRICRPLGTLVLKSTFTGPLQIDLTKLVVSEITVLGSRCGPFAPALRLMEQTAVNITPLINAVYSLQDGVAAFAHAAQPDIRKVLLYPDGPPSR